jgi:hypothetical protein
MPKYAPLGFLAWFLVFALPLGAADRVGEASSGQVPDRDDLVFFPLDDVSIPWRENLKVVLRTPKKFEGNPVVRAGPPEGPDGYGAVLYGTVIKENGRLRMWYLASPRPDGRIPGDFEHLQFYRPVAYAESGDGIHWTRPDLGLVEFRGSRHNNLVAVEPAGEPFARAHDFVAVLRDTTDPDPARRYKMAYIHDSAADGPTTATAVSADGLRWTLANTASFTHGHFENTSLVKFDGRYYVAGQDHPPFDGSLPDGSSAGRVMKVFFSPDFHHWSSGRALGFYRSDYVSKPTHLGQEVHMGAGLWNRGNVILGLYGRWRGDTLPTPPDPSQRLSVDSLKGLKIDLGLVVSNDAIHYREPVRNFVMVRHGDSRAWDSEGVLQANAFANNGRETYIWYSHWNTSNPSHLPPLPDPLPESLAGKAPGIGLLTLPRDRFGYFTKLLDVSREHRPEYDEKIESSCVTRRVRLDRPSRLFANVDWVSPDAALEIALVDDAEKPLEGYTSHLPDDGLKAPVAWGEGNTALPVHRSFRIKVTWPVLNTENKPVDVSQAILYALYIEHD